MKIRTLMKAAFLLALAGCSSIPWVETDRPNCVADVFFPAKYERLTWSGQCVDGKASGQGTLISSSGTRLEGTFRGGIVQDAKGRISMPRADGQRVLIGATFKGGQGDFYHLKKEPADSQAYARRIAQTFRSEIIFTEKPSMNPVAVVELLVEPDGKVASSRLSEPSTLASWDTAVMNAVAKVVYLPSDTDGIVPPRMILEFRRY